MPPRRVQADTTMHLTIQTTRLALTDDLRGVVGSLVAEALRTMGAPPEAEVLVTLSGPERRGSHRHRAEIVIHEAGGALTAAGHGHDTVAAAGSLRRALLRQATNWQEWHDGGLPTSAGHLMMHGQQIPDPESRPGEPGRNPNADVTKRPHGYR